MYPRGGERTAPQYFLSHKPFVVVFVKFGAEAGIRHVIRTRPFPNVANHLMSAVCALSAGKGADRRYRPELVFREVRLSCFGSACAPGKFIFESFPRIEAGGLLPFGLRRQPLPHPFRVSRRFIKTEVRDRLAGLILHSMQSVIIAEHPFVASLLPVEWSFPMFTAHELPTLCQPAAKIPITAALYESEEIAVAHRRAVDRVI